MHDPGLRQDSAQAGDHGSGYSSPEEAYIVLSAKTWQKLRLDPLGGTESFSVTNKFLHYTVSPFDLPLSPIPLLTVVYPRPLARFPLLPSSPNRALTSESTRQVSVTSFSSQSFSEPLAILVLSTLLKVSDSTTSPVFFSFCDKSD